MAPRRREHRRWRRFVPRATCFRRNSSTPARTRRHSLLPDCRAASPAIAITAFSIPRDALIGTDDKSVCGQCHTEGDPGFVAANSIRDHLAQLAAAIDRSDQILSKAERSGMEVSQARLDLVQTRDTLTKARVTIHSANVARVQQDIQPGLASADKNYEAGKEALKERNYRRYGLGLSLIAIAIVLTGLRMYLKQIESGQNSQTT